MNNAPHPPKVIRAFTAVYPSPEVAGRLRVFQQQLREAAPSGVSWTLPTQLHLTLQFLGGIEQMRLARYRSVLEAAVARCEPFRLRAESAGCFPTKRNPKILWAGLAAADTALARLKQIVDRPLEPLGFRPEARPFHPHLTLGRVKALSPRDAKAAADVLSRAEGEFFGEWNVENIYLMESELSGAGAVHSVLFAIPLGR